MDKDAEDDIAEFEEQELQYVLMVSSHFSRAGLIFAHTLQLVARKFDTFPSVKKVIAKVYHLLTKFNKSCKATEKLIQLSGKKLIANCPTRWSSTFLVIARLLHLWPHVAVVCEDLNWDCLQ